MTEDTKAEGEIENGDGKKHGKLKKWQCIVLIILVLFVAVVAAVAVYIHHLDSNIQRPADNFHDQIVVNDTPEPEPATEAAVSEPTPTPKPADKTRDIALFGVDARSNSLGKGNRSDCIIVAHVNESKKQIKLYSVYRDTYASIPGYKSQKITHAYAFGDAILAINTLNLNFDLQIEDFVTVNFAVMEDIINLLGGVTVDVQPEEVKWLNGYVHSLHVENPSMNELSYISGSGVQTLNGSQAVAYCRIRYTAGGDMKRAERQRLILEKIMDKAKSMKPKALLKIAETASKEVYTSLKLKEILKLAKSVYDYEIIQSEGFPYHIETGSVNGASVVKPITYLDDVVTLHRDVYGESAYKPSKKVKNIAEGISFMQKDVTVEDPGKRLDE